MKVSFDNEEILSAIDRVAKRHIRQPEKQSTWNF